MVGAAIIIAALCVSSSRQFQNTMIIGIFLCVVTLLSVGFFVPVYETPAFVQIFANFNYMRVHLESIIIILFKERCESTPILYKSYGINESQLSSNLDFLIIEGIIFRFIGLIIFICKTNSNLVSKTLKIFTKNNYK